MEEINQIGQIILNYGVSAVIIIVFIWDYVVNKKKNAEKHSNTAIYQLFTIILNFSPN